MKMIPVECGFIIVLPLPISVRKLCTSSAQYLIKSIVPLAVEYFLKKSARILLC